MDLETADPVDSALGLVIRVRRRLRSMSQSELGERLGVSFQQIQKYERGYNRMTVSLLIRTAKALDSSVGAIVRDLEAIAPAFLQSSASGALAQPESGGLLEALASISSPERRNAILALARGLAAEKAERRETCESPGTPAA